MIRFQVSKPVLMGREREYALEAIESGWISSVGSYIGKFETAVARVIDVDDCIAVCNGTAALHLACLAMGVQPGDEVVVPALTYVASANCIAYCGGRPVFADSDPATWNVSVQSVEAVVTPRTKGIIVVHLYGTPAPADELADFCRARGLWMIEDCAESLGARLNGRATGTFGDAATFSFYGNKVISTGEGGAVYVPDPELAQRIRTWRGQGMDPNRRYWHSVIGYNYRMTNVAAAIGLGQIEQAAHHLSERRRIACGYLRGLDRLAQDGLITLPLEPANVVSTYWLFSIVLATGGEPRRARIQAILEADHGIETRPFFVPMHRLPMYRGETSGLTAAERLGDHGLNLPTYTGLTEGEIGEICVAVDRVVRTTA